MAVKPDEGETFLREVDEELRKDQVSRFMTRYGWWIVGAGLLVLAATGGWLWWQHRQQAAAATQAETLIDALDSAEAGNRTASAAKVAELADSGIEGYRAAALFARANNEVSAGNAPAAIATLRAIAENEDFDRSYREAALIRQTALEFDSLRPQVVIQRLGPLAVPGSAWLGSAGEMVGIAHLKMRRPDLAGPLFARIARDETVPETIRTRAIQMAGSLGINALDEPGAGQPGTPARPAATRE